MTWHLCPGTITVKILVWPVDLDEPDNRSNVQWIYVQNYEKQIFQPKNFFAPFLHFAVLNTGENRREHLIERLVFDLISLMKHGEAVGPFPGLHHVYRKPCSQPPASIMQKKGKLIQSDWGGGGRGGGLRGKIALEQPLHVQWEWTFSH